MNPESAHPAAPQPPAAYPAMSADEIPPGVQEVILPSGERALAYSTGPSTPPPVSPTAPAAQPIPAWAKTTALLAPTVGGGIGAASVGLSYAAPGLIAMSQALWSAVALIATSAVAAAALMWSARRSSSRPAPTHITQNITASGLFGRANGTIHH